MEEIVVALVGQPNVGKSSLINAISGAHLKVGNFAGVTVEKTQVSTTYNNTKITIVDLPGIYALNDFTIEEKVSRQFLETERFDLILNVLDCTNLERNLSLSTQLLNTPHKVLMALNMWDEAQKEGLQIDVDLLSKDLGVPCIPTSAHAHFNMDHLLDRLISLHRDAKDVRSPLTTSKEEAFEFCRALAKKVCRQTQGMPEYTRRIDKYMMHPIYGVPIFLGLMFLVFFLSFLIGGTLQGYVDDGFSWLSDTIKTHAPNAQIGSLLGDGIIGGVGAVLSFLPLIMVLYLGISLLEATGYMSRVAFLLDGVFHKFGLHGKSFIPLITGFGCSVPAYMATRTLQNQHERLVTLFVIGFMSCSARLPIYVLFVGSFFPEKYASLVLFIIYVLGAVIALLMAKFLKLSVFKGKEESFVMEMPKYRMPSPKVIWYSIYTKSLSYLKKAGTYILAGAILIWFASAYPRDAKMLENYQVQQARIEASNLEATAKEEALASLEDKKQQEILENSFVGRVGRSIDGLFKPMDFDWRLSISLVTGFMAKEVVVSTLGVLYALGDTKQDSKSFREALKKYVSVPSAIAFIVFVMFYIPCFAATITFGKEAGGIKFVLYLFIFTTAVAYIFSCIAYYATKLLAGIF
ncbi:ferrous iron transport protein B [Helicobacter baculiformis]|uniref:Ferrous iron transport protein B n=1 Tax=Helicobacter baculiformis TaxID=427351 RepID=A0A1M4NGS9_9HELI|nr:ferrous iron transport protein B [Helicobacter baculiformis]SFZ71431.1 OMP1281 [Helicobacter baculiformis]